MSHTYAKNHLHVIFSTKQREKLIPKNLQPKLWSYMAGIFHNREITPIAINGTDDHAHALFHLPLFHITPSPTFLSVSASTAPTLPPACPRVAQSPMIDAWPARSVPS